jgi:FdhD protein
MNNSTFNSSIVKFNASGISKDTDTLAVEEPLEISLTFISKNLRRQKNISITMRTPGNDDELGIGFLFTEGIIKSRNEVLNINQSENTVILELAADVSPDIEKLERHFYTSSSCGVCGKSSIDSVRTQTPAINSDDMQITPQLLCSLPSLLRKNQEIFESTGGLHASALFNNNGDLLAVREDVGRHNALDKLIGFYVVNGKIPLNNTILLLSGRASFELLQKAAMASIPFVASVGAPSSLAVELAKENNITLAGFLRAERFNVYSGKQRINLN